MVRLSFWVLGVGVTFQRRRNLNNGNATAFVVGGHVWPGGQYVVDVVDVAVGVAGAVVVRVTERETVRLISRADDAPSWSSSWIAHNWPSVNEFKNDISKSWVLDK